MPQIPHRIVVDHDRHPGSSREEIDEEPDWSQTRQQGRIGYRDHRQNRFGGLTHEGDDDDDEQDREFERIAAGKAKELHQKEAEHGLVDFRAAIEGQPDYHLRHPAREGLGWRYRLDLSEDDIKQNANWPANQARKQQQAEQKRNQDQEKGEQADSRRSSDAASHDQQQVEANDTKAEHEMEGADHQSKHNDARPPQEEELNGHDEKARAEYEKLRGKYSPQTIALLRAIREEKQHMAELVHDDGTGVSPVASGEHLITIDEADNMTPDNWIPRSDKLVRLTGKHPLNAEPRLDALFEAGLITPNELHYVRNHAAVPHLLWDTHVLDVDGGSLELSMHQLKHEFAAINIPVALACDGNRRRELNMLKRSKGFNWGSGAVSCAYWRGPHMADVLYRAGVRERERADTRWVNFEGADDPSEGKYATCLPLSYAMDRNNDVILAYEMNDMPLPPDHGHPVRIIIPGYVGGRSVKWLQRIWVSENENDSYYHLWDNRVLPSFITEKDGEFADAMFRHPDTACNEQNLNSVIAKPAHGQKIKLSMAKRGKTFCVEGYAYDGGGCKVERVEISLDEGQSWLYCIRNFPHAPIRNGKKYWTWVHWRCEVELAHLVRCPSITVRSWNVFKNSQPERPSWNIMGMMNNCWYRVKPEVVIDENTGESMILFRHPTEPGQGQGGWMKPSQEEQLSAAKQSAGTPQKQFSRAEIEKHDKEDDAWIVIDGKVCDVTSVLSWHPGGKATILAHAGIVHQETTDAYSSIHDAYATSKMGETVIGQVTDKGKKYIEQQAKEAASEQAKSAQGVSKVILNKHRWVPVTLKERTSLSKDTRLYKFQTSGVDDKKALGLGTCQHMQLGFHLKDKMLIRPYTPTRPILESEEDGSFDLVIKTYFPNDQQPGGAMSNILDVVPLGSEIEVKGPTGEIEYRGEGRFMINGKEMHFDKLNLIVGGSGVTPGFQLVSRVVRTPTDRTQIRLIDSNKTEDDILLKDELDRLQSDAHGQLQVTHVISHPKDEQGVRKGGGVTGRVNDEVISGRCFGPGEGVASFLCGPPAMIQKAALPALKKMGFTEDENCFGF